jgi:hypothetical protein
MVESILGGGAFGTVYRGRQIGLFAPDGAHAEEAIAVAQFLRTRLGAATVLQPHVVDADARLPERAAEWEEVVR